MFYVLNVAKVHWVAMVNVSDLCWHTQKSSEWSCLCVGCDKKKARCTRASAADTFDLQQVSDGVHGVSNMGRWSGYSSMPEWRSMAYITARCFWLNNYCLSCVRSVPSSSNEAMFLFTECAAWQSVQIATAVDHKIWGEIQQRMYQLVILFVVTSGSNTHTDIIL